MADLRVLLIDDDETTNFLHRRVIARTGISADVEVAFDGRAGLAALQRLVDAGDPLPSLILLDLNMPRMNGFEFLDSYASLPEDVRVGVHVVMVTSSVLSADRTRALEHPLLRGIRSKPLSVPDARELLEGVVASLAPADEPASDANGPRASVDELVRAGIRLPLAALDNLDIAAWVCVVDDSRVVWANRRGLELWGATSIDALGERDWDNNTPAARAGVRHMWETARRDGRSPSRWTLHPNGDPGLSRTRAGCRHPSTSGGRRWSARIEISRRSHTSRAMTSRPRSGALLRSRSCFGTRAVTGWARADGATSSTSSAAAAT